MIRGFLFDMDGTLYDADICDRYAAENYRSYCCQVLGIRPAQFDVLFPEAKRLVKAQLGQTGASHHRLLYSQRLCELTGKSALPRAADMEESYWSVYLDHMALYDGVLEFLDELDRRQIRTCVVTNLTSLIQFRKLAQLELSERIDFLVTSEEAGVEKPDPGIFSFALKKLGITADDAVMIGDNFDLDVTGAAAAGIAPIWFNRRGPGREGYRDVQQFSEILPYLSFVGKL